MKNKYKILMIFVLAIALIMGGYYCYNDVLVPKIFDYFVENNIDSVKKLEKDLEKDTTKSPEEQIEKDIAKEETGTDIVKTPENTTKPSQQQDPKAPVEEKQYEAKTSIGSFSNADLLKAMKTIKGIDKARIIGILKAGVPASQVPKFAAMAKDGLNSEEKRYIENYMRSNLSVSSKTEILEILKKYVK